MSKYALLFGSLICLAGCATSGTGSSEDTVYSTLDGPNQWQHEVKITDEQLAKAGSNERADGCEGVETLNVGELEDARRRITPTMPPTAKKSGHCMIRFDVDREGDPTHVKALSCSDPFFKNWARMSVAKWSYDPLVINGSVEPQCGVETAVTYRLTKSGGRVVPE